jgi:type IX secretion system PorP/SprF family membrane protein
MKKLCLHLSFLLLPSYLLAQDIHFSQYDYTSALANPALIGSFAGNAYQRASVNYRNQWQGVPVAYNSVLASWDREIKHKVLKNNSLGIGFSIIHDAAGDSKLGLTEVNLLCAYHFFINKNNTLSAGTALGYGIRRFDSKNLRFDNQFNDGFFDGTQASQENFTNTNFGFFDAAANVAWRYQKANRSMWISANIQHLNTPEQSFYGNGGSVLPINTSFTMGGKLPLAKRLDMQPSLHAARQGAYFEFLGTILFDYHLNEQRFKKINLLFGMAYRNEDAIIPTVGMRYNAWRVALSYDVNISKFNIATRGLGGPEISLQHFWYKVVPNPKNKACPVY